MSSQSRRTTIPRAVVRRLVEDARARCCMCRVLIDPRTFDEDALFGSLDKHHIVFFSEGGGDTYENLMLVCANCHRTIHRDKVPPDELRQKKLHWINMKDVVPCHRDSAWPDACILHLTPDGSPRHGMPLRPVDFLLESVNLRYCLMVNENDFVHSVASFIRRKILQPLGQYDENQSWAAADRVRLAPHRDPTSMLAHGLQFGDPPLVDVDALVGIIFPPVMMALASDRFEEIVSPETVARVLWELGMRYESRDLAEVAARVIARGVAKTLADQLPGLEARSRWIYDTCRRLEDEILYVLRGHERQLADSDYLEASMWVTKVVNDKLSAIGCRLQL